MKPENHLQHITPLLIIALTIFITVYASCSTCCHNPLDPNACSNAFNSNEKGVCCGYIYSPRYNRDLPYCCPATSTCGISDDQRHFVCHPIPNNQNKPHDPSPIKPNGNIVHDDSTKNASANSGSGFFSKIWWIIVVICAALVFTALLSYCVKKWRRTFASIRPVQPPTLDLTNNSNSASGNTRRGTGGVNDDVTIHIPPLQQPPPTTRLYGVIPNQPVSSTDITTADNQHRRDYQQRPSQQLQPKPIYHDEHKMAQYGDEFKENDRNNMTHINPYSIATSSSLDPPHTTNLSSNSHSRQNTQNPPHRTAANPYDSQIYPYDPYVISNPIYNGYAASPYLTPAHNPPEYRSHFDLPSSTRTNLTNDPHALPSPPSYNQLQSNHPLELQERSTVVKTPVIHQSNPYDNVPEYLSTDTPAPPPLPQFVYGLLPSLPTAPDLDNIVEEPPSTQQSPPIRQKAPGHNPAAVGNIPANAGRNVTIEQPLVRDPQTSHSTVPAPYTSQKSYARKKK